MFETEAMKIYLGPFLAVLPRTLALFLVLPVLPAAVPQVVIKGGLGASIALFFYPIANQWTGLLQLSSLELALLFLKECTIGALIGFGLSSLWWALNLAGNVIDSVSGTSSANMLDPITNQEQGIFGSFFGMFASVLIISLGFLQLCVSALIWSFAAFPLFEWKVVSPTALISLGDRTLTDIFRVAMMVCAPFIVLIGLVDVALGLIARNVPQFPASLVLPGIKIVLTFFILVLALTSLALFVGDLASTALPRIQQLFP
jgi:flagellar biosynthesis protein FliR